MALWEIDWLAEVRVAVAAVSGTSDPQAGQNRLSAATSAEQDVQRGIGDPPNIEIHHCHGIGNYRIPRYQKDDQTALVNGTNAPKRQGNRVTGGSLNFKTTGR
jgi:hypothetical protein